MAKVNVRLFSVFREKAGTSHAAVEVDSPATVRDIVRALVESFPVLAPYAEAGAEASMLVSVNLEHASPDEPVREGDEVAVFPPVSGGDSPRRAVLLLSGGFDSPVAGKVAQMDGSNLDAIHFSFEPLTDDASTRKAILLAASMKLPVLHVVTIGPALAQIARTCRPGYYFVLQKRFMYRLANRLADELDAQFLVTGENLGQVSSQTLANLATLDPASRRPVLRPLLGMDKDDIVQWARRWGTFEVSKGPEVCDVLGPNHPNTAANGETAALEESKADLDALLGKAWATRERRVTLADATALSPPR